MATLLPDLRTGSARATHELQLVASPPVWQTPSEAFATSASGATFFKNRAPSGVLFSVLGYFLGVDRSGESGRAILIWGGGRRIARQSERLEN